METQGSRFGLLSGITKAMVIACSLFILLLPATTKAQVEAILQDLSDEQLEHVDLLLDLALQAESEERWNDAATLYAAIYDIIPADEYLWNEALCLEQAGELDRASQMYLRLTESVVPEIAQAAVEQLALLSVPSEQTVPVEPDSESHDTAALEEQPPENPAPPEPKRNLTWTYVLGGASIASLGIGITFGVLSNRREADARDYDLSAPDASPNDLATLRDDAERFATWANVGFIASGVFAVGAVIATFASAPDDGQSPGLEAFVPFVYEDGGGGVVRWRF